MGPKRGGGKGTMISRESILAETQYGVDIYCHILHGLYTGEVIMRQNGRDCGFVRNPFASGEKTLHVERVRLAPEKKLSDEIARHHDTSGTIPDGDCFDFAERHYGLAGQMLLNKINEEMSLHLENDYEPYRPCAKRTAPSIIEQVHFSFFKAPINNIVPYKNITLSDAFNYITGNYATERTLKLRTFTDTKYARNFKAANFDYCTFSGTFRQRSETSLIEHSGLLCLDFDHLLDVESLFLRLLEDEYFETQLLFRSPSGDGLKWVVSINVAEMPHGDYFRAVSNYVLETYGIAVDKSGKDIPRACFLPYDPQAFINPELKQL